MTNKVIKLHMKMVETEFAASIVLMSIGMIFSGGVVVIFPVILVVTAIILLRGFNKIFRTSLVGDDGEIIMSLPITAKQLIIGKISVIAIWTTSISIGVFLTFTGFLLLSGILEDGFRQAFEQILEPYIESGITPIEGGIISVLIVIETTLSAVGYGLICLLLQLNNSTSRKKAGVYSMVMLIIGLIIAMAVVKGIDLGSTFLIDTGLNAMVVVLIRLMLEICICVGIFKICQNKLEHRYDLING